MSQVCHDTDMYPIYSDVLSRLICRIAVLPQMNQKVVHWPSPFWYARNRARNRNHGTVGSVNNKRGARVNTLLEKFYRVKPFDRRVLTHGSTGSLARDPTTSFD